MFSCKFYRIFLNHNNMYTQQFIKSVKKICLWYLYGRFREQIFKKSTILDKNIETFIKIRQIWKHTPPSVNWLTASYRKSLTVPENRLTNPSPVASFLHTVIISYNNGTSYVNYLPNAFYFAVISCLLNFLIFLDVLYCSHLIILTY